ncbi:MAG: nitroreductase family protein [Bacteroidales bacterium]|nr:nitroreductase family protein [Bacteroidales bacterium]NPV36061.1 nitroreductase family protein [Bacteroidales bacterium]
MDIIRERRSIRKFKTTDISQEDVHSILDAAMHAPSAGNQRPWHFIVFRNEETKKMLAQTGPNARFAAECPVVILVCGDTSRETHKGYWPVDCAAAVQNMLLEATARGLGSLWLGVYPRQERIDYLSQNLQLPKHIVPFALVCFGYAADHPSKRGFYDPALVSFERWNKQTIQ